MNNLRTKLTRLNNNKYSLYEALLGEYNYKNFRLRIDEIQADPFAPPSKATLLIPFNSTMFDKSFLENPARTLSFCDSFARIIAQEGRRLFKEKKGSGNSGFFGIRYGKQKVIDGNAVLIKADIIEIRVLFGLPAYGRSIAASEALELFFKELPLLIESILDKKYNAQFLKAAALLERQIWLREECRKKGLIAFVGNNSILARENAVSDRPLQNAVPFISPKSLEVAFTCPDGFVIRGMGISKGVTLIAGGAYHGKSTLLSALSHGIYNHILGDGREYCLSAEDSVFLRAEDGRPVSGTDISPFIHSLPEGKSSTFFESSAASGSSSQAANLMESLEVGSSVFLVDEDISATNFLVKDERMRLLVPEAKETITPLIAALPHFKKMGVSFIMVSGALGDFLAEADKVIVAENYCYKDATLEAKKISLSVKKIAMAPFIIKQSRTFIDESISYFGRKDKAYIDGEPQKVRLGREEILLSAWHQLCDYAQYGTLAAVIAYAKKRGYLNDTPEHLKKCLEADIKKFGWDLFSDVGVKSWRYTAALRPVDIHAALCRLPSLKCTKL